MMILLVLGFCFLAIVLLLASGYLLGVRDGSQSRENLRALNRAFAKDLARYRERPTIVHGEDSDLRSAIQTILTPLVQRERLTIDMSHLDAGLGQHRDLASMLDQMAEKGNFSSVLLSDAQGWRVAASSATQDPERLAATASLLLLLADRIGRDGAPTPLSLMVHDTSNATTLCRLFSVGSQRLTLTVVATGTHLTPSTLDPALVRLNAMLLNRDGAETTRRAGEEAPAL